MNDNPTIKLEMTLAQLNYVMQCLGKQPYEQVADLVQVIRDQAVPQLPTADPAKPAG